MICANFNVLRVMRIFTFVIHAHHSIYNIAVKCKRNYGISKYTDSGHATGTAEVRIQVLDKKKKNAIAVRAQSCLYCV